MTINSTTRKTNPFVGNGSAHTFPFAFKVFTDEDIVVKKLETSTNTETTLTLGINNDYIVTLNADQNSNPGGSITLKSGGNNQTLASGFTIVITSAVEPLQGTDLTNQGGFFPEVINDALDKSAILHQQQQTELDRAIKFSLTNTIGSFEITENANARKNRVLGFDNLGEFEVLKELGTYRGNWSASTAYAVRDLVKDTSTNNIFFCNTAHTSSGSQPLTTNTNSANWDLIVDAATATTASNNAASSATAAANSATAAANSATAAASSQTAAASSATTASTKATQADTAKTAAETAKTAAETAQTAAETALDSFDDRYLGAKSSNPTLDNDGNALIDGALYFNTTVNRMRVYDLGNTSWLEVTISGSDLTNTNTVAGAISNVNAVGGNISNVNAVASNATNINAVNSNSSNINTVAGAASNISNVSGSIANVNTVGGGIANVNTVAAEINNNKLQTVANNINAVVTAANDLNEATSEIDTVANAITNVDNVGNSISNVNTVAGALSNINAVAGNASNVNTVAGAITNVNNVGGSIANVNTVANNLSGVNSFAERYRTDNTGNNPSTSLNAGDLFYNQASGKLLVYNGNTSAWEETQSVGSFFINTLSSFSGTGGGSATFNNTAYKFTLSNAGQFAQQMLVSINGVIQKPNAGSGQPSEGFALDGANIVFAAPPPSGADFFIVTIGASVSIGTPSDGTVTESKLNVSNNPVNGYFLQAQSGAAGGLTWAQVTTDLVGDSSPQLGGNLDVNTKNILFGDSSDGSSDDVLSFGASADFKIWHDGSYNWLDAVNNHDTILRAGTSGLYLQGSVVFIGKEGASEYSIKAISDGAVQLFHDNVLQIETLSTGFKSIAAGNRRVTIGSTDASGAMLVLDGDSNGDGSGNDYAFIQHNTDGELQIENYKSAAIRFATAGIDRFKIDASGHLLPAADSTYNIGSNSVRVANGYFDTLYGDGSNLTGISSVGGANSVTFNDNVQAKFGTDQDMRLYHNDTDGQLANSKGNLILANSTDGEIFIDPKNNERGIVVKPDAGVEIYHNNIKKLESESSGINIISSTPLLNFNANNVAQCAQFQVSESSGGGVLIVKNKHTSGNLEEAYRINNDGTFSFSGAGVMNGAKLNIANNGTHITCKSFSTGGYDSIFFRSANTNVGKIFFNSGGTQYHTSSDYRRKENIVDLTGAIDRVKLLQPKRFNFKTDSSTTLDGFLAHEVTPAVPEAIQGTKDQVANAKDVEEGRADEIGDPIYQTIDQSTLIPLLTGALKEAIAKIETLETKVAVLEGA